MTDIDAIGWISGGTPVAIGLVALVKWAWNHINNRFDTLEKGCATCRENIERRLLNGNQQFEELEKNANKTQLDIMRVVSESSLNAAEYQKTAQEKFVTEATFRDRVIAIMVQACPNCRKGGMP